MRMPFSPPRSNPDDPTPAIARRLARGPHPKLSHAARQRLDARVLAALPAPIAPPRRARLARWGALAACAALALALIAVWSAVAPRSPGPALEARLERAERQLDAGEALLRRGELPLRTLDRAAQDLSAALDLLAEHSGHDPAAARLFALSVRYVALAERAGALARADDRALATLAQGIAHVTPIGVAARELAGEVVLAAAPMPESAPLSLAPESAVLLPRAAPDRPPALSG